MCCWQTVDSSPQMSHEWVLNGMVAMRASHLPDRFIDALKLPRREPGENVVGAVKRLRGDLVISLGSPAAVAGGNAGLVAKMHATMHARRMQAESWRHSCMTMNVAATWVGDLGIESRFNRFRGHV